jgi:hypothetical protein
MEIKGVGGVPVASTISARQRKLVQDGAKGVAERWVSDPEDGAKSRAAFRSSVKRYSGKEAPPPESEPSPQQRTRKRSVRAEQAATGMMGPPPTTFDEKAIKDWLGKMSHEDLQKLSRLAALAKQGKETGRSAWNKVDRGIKQQEVHVQVNGGTVTVNTAAPSSFSPQRKNTQSADWGRRLARIKDFING